MKQIINPYMPLSEHFTLGEMLSSQKATEKGIPNTPLEKHITAMKNLAVQLKKHRSDVDRIITKYGLFVIDGSRFTSLWMQQLYSKDAAKLLHSRAYLSMRAEDIDIDIEKEKKKKCVFLGDTHSQFETLRAGRRYASHGQPLPGEAPPQRRRNDMYSYIRHDWVPAEEFDKDAEMIVYRQLFGKEDA